VSLVTLPAVTTAFASDSFSQKVGDQYIWELKVAPPGSDLNIWKVGDQLKIVISAANKTMIGPVLWDILWGTMYNNSAANRTWQLLQPTDIICYYNNTKGWYLGDMYAYMFMFIPHNQTTVNSTLFWEFAYILGLMGDFHYTWTSGPHGYDGTMTAWNGSATGDLGQPKYEIQFNVNGVLQYSKSYNGTGSGWTLIADWELLSGSGIPGFIAIPLLLVLSIFVAFQLLRAKKKPVAI